VTEPVYAKGVDEYRSRGWTDAVPLPAGQKFPPPSGFTGAEAKTPTAAQIEVWKRTEPAGNLALHLPDGIVGLDVDHYGDKTGADTIAALSAAWGPLPPTWISTARPLPSGIQIYRVEKGTELVGVAGAGVEVIQRRHRYLCCWPSTNPRASGASYQWLAPGGRVAAGPPSPDELADLPTAWVEGLSPRKVVAGPVFVTTDGRRSGYAGAALDRAAREVASAPAGQGNGVLNGCAYSLGRLVGAGLLDRTTAEDALVHAAVLRGGETEGRARTIVRSGLGAGMANPRRVAIFEQAR